MAKASENNGHMYLPKNLGVLHLACDETSSRYALGGVCLTKKEGGYEVAATDTRMLVVVKGSQNEVTPIPHLEDAVHVGGSADQGVIPSLAWKRAFSEISASKSKKNLRPRVCCIHLGNKEASLAVETASDVSARKCQTIEGRFPRYTEVLPKEKPKASFCIKPQMLIKCLEIVSQFGENVDMDFWDDKSAIQMKTKNSDGQECVVLLMPVSREK